MSAILAQIPIRCQINLAGNPPFAPFDRNTGGRIRLWRGQTAALQIGIFDASGNPVDLSNLSSLTVSLYKDSAAIQPNWVVTELAVDLDALITTQGWANGTQQNANVVLSAAMTDQSCGGTDSQDYLLVVSGTNASDGSPLIYGSGLISIVQPAAGFPPVWPSGYTSRHKQAVAAGDFTITPTSQLHKEVVSLSGGARNANCLLGINGIQDGAELTIMWGLPATAGIVYSIRNSVVTNPPLAAVPTGTVLACRTKFYFDSDLVSWVPEKFDFPAP